jgi:hypothetical protein
MPYSIDPQTGLPVDEQGNLVDAATAGSDTVSESDYPQQYDPNEIDFTPEEAAQVPDGEETQMPAMDVGTDTKQSVSYRGMTPGGLKRSGSLFDRAEARAGQEFAPIAEDTARSIAQTKIAYNERADAIQQIAKASKESSDRQADLLIRQLDFQEHQKELEEQAAAESHAVSQAYITQYREQLAAVNQLAQMNANPLAQLSGGQALGLAGAQFAQGFLKAAYGIGIDVSGQVDKWIDRELQQHQMKVQNMRQGAQDTLHLYDIARQSSQDDYEARQRYRGFVIQGLKTAIEIEAQRFESGVADARAQEQTANLAIEALKTEQTLKDNAYNKYMQMKQLQIQRASQEGQLAISQASLAEQRRHHGELEKAASAKAEKAGDVREFRDPTTGKLLGTISKGQLGDEKRYEKASGAEEAYRLQKPLMDRAVQLYNEASKKGILGEKWWLATDPVAREFHNTITKMAMHTQLAQSGKSSTDQEFARIMGLFPIDKTLQLGGNDKIIINYLEDERNKYDSAIKEYTDAPAGYDQTNRPSADPKTKAMHEAYTKGGAPVTSFGEREYEVAADATGDYQESGQTRQGRDFGSQALRIQASNAWHHLMGTPDAPENHEAVDHMVAAVVDPSMLRRLPQFKDQLPSDEELQKEGMEALQRMASEHVSGDGSLSDDNFLYAKKWLEVLQKDPEGAAKLLHNSW